MEFEIKKDASRRSLGRVGKRLGGVAELSFGVFEGSEACGTTSKGGKAT